MVRRIVVSLIFLIPLFGWANEIETPGPPRKIITIIVDPTGMALIGPDTLYISALAPEVQRRLFKSYMGTGKMYDAIRLEFHGEVLMGTRGAAMDAIKLGQSNALKEVCIHLHKKYFADLTPRQQKKIRRQFPVLFQDSFD
jgi:hypothetical protein